MNIVSRRIEFTEASLKVASRPVEMILNHALCALNGAQAFYPAGVYCIIVDQKIYEMLQVHATSSGNLVEKKTEIPGEELLYLYGCKVEKTGDPIDPNMRAIEVRTQVLLEGCPFCNVIGERLQMIDDKDNHYFARCYECQAEGPYQIGQVAAAEAWNRVYRKMRGV
jgi:hypothetical protein